MRGNERCCKCASAASESELVTLWDDQTYCRSCVRNASPRLLEMAIDKTPFCRTVVWPKTMLLRNLILWSIAYAILTVAIPFVVFCSCAIAIRGFSAIDPATVGFLAGTAFGAILATYLVMGAIMFIGNYFARPPQFTACWIAKGKIHYGFNYLGKKATGVLKKCEWSRKRTRFDLSGGWCLTPHDAIVIRFYRESRFWWRRLVPLSVVIDGSTETLQLWQDFLTLAEVPVERKVDLYTAESRATRDVNEREDLR